MFLIASSFIDLTNFLPSIAVTRYNLETKGIIGLNSYAPAFRPRYDISSFGVNETIQFRFRGCGVSDYVCPRCQFVNVEQTPVCVECGQLLTDDLDATRPLTFPGTRQRIHTLIFQIGDDQLSISLKMAERLILGRQSNHMTDRPDLDLARFKAAEHGISRIHATLECNEVGVYLMDLGSLNGTFVNGQALGAFNPCYLNDGDVLRFGKLTITLALVTEENGDNRFAVSTHARSKTGKLEESIRLMRV